MTAALPKGAIVAVIGAGTMGPESPRSPRSNGHRVQLHDTRLGAGDAAKRGIAEALDKQVDKGRLSRADADASLGRIATVVTLPDVCVANLVVEAIVEDLAAKHELFERIENVVDAKLRSRVEHVVAVDHRTRRACEASRTHRRDALLQSGAADAARGSGDRALDIAGRGRGRLRDCARVGKTPVYATSTPGFIVNRCARPYYAEGLRLLAERAADIATLDAVFRESGGFRMGPFELIDLIGLDVNLAVTKSVWAAYFNDPRYAPSVLAGGAGRGGVPGPQVGRGFYDYSAGATKAEPNTEPPHAKPAQVIVHGELGVAAPLAERIAAGGLSVERARADSRFPCGSDSRSREAAAARGSR
jgi:3-hydroxybutyryl-CoA dehydrogenase